jgi:hypothetical protein
MDMATDINGNIYVCGSFEGTATFGSLGTLTSSGGYDGFVAKLGPNGNWLWATKMGGASGDNINGVSVDSSGNVYIVGYFNGTAGFGSLPALTSSGSSDIFVARLSSAGAWQWAVKAADQQGF